MTDENAAPSWVGDWCKACDGADARLAFLRRVRHQLGPDDRPTFLSGMCKCRICRLPPPSGDRQWPELVAAYDRLRAVGVDLDGIEGQNALLVYSFRDRLRGERPHVERVVQALDREIERLRAVENADDNARVVREFTEQMKGHFVEWTSAADRFVPVENHRPTNRAKRALGDYAARRGAYSNRPGTPWSADTFADFLLVRGLDDRRRVDVLKDAKRLLQ